jgi:hypothetical protein
MHNFILFELWVGVEAGAASIGRKKYVEILFISNVLFWSFSSCNNSTVHCKVHAVSRHCQTSKCAFAANMRKNSRLPHAWQGCRFVFLCTQTKKGGGGWRGGGGPVGSNLNWNWYGALESRWILSPSVHLIDIIYALDCIWRGSTCLVVSVYTSAAHMEPEAAGMGTTVSTPSISPFHPHLFQNCLGLCLGAPRLHSIREQVLQYTQGEGIKCSLYALTV